MVAVTFVSFGGDAQVVRARGGQSAMEVALDHGVEGIEAQCGGACSCGTCHVIVDQDWFALLPPAGALESDLLDGIEARRPRSRLSCQIKLTESLDGLVLATPEYQG